MKQLTSWIRRKIDKGLPTVNSKLSNTVVRVDLERLDNYCLLTGCRRETLSYPFFASPRDQWIETIGEEHVWAGLTVCRRQVQTPVNERGYATQELEYRHHDIW